MATNVRQDQVEPRTRRAVASFDRYEDAQAAVDRLADARFPVERVAIVALGLRLEEQVTGRMTLGRATAQAAVSGAIIGALIGWLLGLFNAIEPLVSALTLALYGLILGALLGALFGAIAHAGTGGRRDFSAVSGLRADQYEVLVDEEVAGAAEEILERPA
jgi:hypothetical protein